MCVRVWIGALAAVLMLCGAGLSRVEAACGDVPRALIVLDRSASMSSAAGSQSKWASATNAINTLTTSFAGRIDFGLMLFPGTASLCAAGSLSVGCGSTTQAAIANAMAATFPQNNTPLGHTLGLAQSYLSTLGTSKPRYVIVVTDGEETCGGDPVSAAQTLAAAGIKTYVVGFGAGVDPVALTALAAAGQTGSYYQADNLAQLDAALKQIAAQLSCCGNGVLDPGEGCDPGLPAGAPGACPKNCDDNDACTQDTIVGGACNLTCNHVTITQPAGGDGCCPPGQTSLTDSDCQPVCGNGVVEAGELCDVAIAAGQPGACPQSCTDNDVCTRDTLAGSGCSATCTHTRITQAAAGDGCCPPGASAATDSDCPAACGNGVVDPGESCDSGIAAGQPGACPTSCDDNDPCTHDVLHAAPCFTKCTHSAITQAVDGDGCCPAGADSFSDSDCGAVCGNGVLDKGETCDEKIPAGQPGACPQSCQPKDSCSTATPSGSGCQRKCVEAPIAPNKTQKDGCCPTGLTDADDADCLPPCTPDKSTDCVNLCAEVTCPDGQFCKLGHCVPWPAGTNPQSEKDPRDADGFYAPDEGCSCSTSSAGARGWPVLLLLLALLATVRRRR
ncbi:MAG: VWA domain-containing protein [Myxococcales bacterium]|nr:VWA domain-containing protein [Myxococcales bacterium]